MDIKFDIGNISVCDDSVHWIIPNFYDLPQVFNTVIRSPNFYFAYRHWNMVVFPNGVSSVSPQGCFGISAVHEISCRGPRDFIVRLGIIGEPEGNTVSSLAKNENSASYRCKKLISRSLFDSRRNHFVPGGNIHLFMSLEKENDDSEAQSKKEEGNKELKQKHLGACIDASTQTKGEIGFEKLKQDFKEILLNGNISDVVLKIEGQEFKAHRCVLAARSPVFLAMMTHETKEKISGVVEIPDVEPNVFSDFLNYLYTGSVENLSLENVVELYTTADKYQVNDLKEMCMDHMMMNVSIDNFCDVLTLSLRHDEKDLKDVCIQFFAKKSLDIILTAKWQTFLSENPIIGNELFIKHIQLNK